MSKRSRKLGFPTFSDEDRRTAKLIAVALPIAVLIAIALLLDAAYR